MRKDRLHFAGSGARMQRMTILTNLKSGPVAHSFVCTIYRRIGQSEEGEDLSKKETYEQKAEALLLPIMEEHGFELVDVEYVKEGSSWYLRAYIDKEGGITVGDCETVSRRFSDLLDAEDFIEDSYIMEVSSPGLGRPLKKEKDYIRSMGKRLEIRTYRSINRKKEFYGTLAAYDADSVTIVSDEEEKLVFQKADLALIRLAFDF